MSSNDLNKTINHLFRQESGKMVSVLVKIFGNKNIDLAEDVVQESLLSALQSWKFKGIPENPQAWLYRVAKNKAIDVIRKNKHLSIFDFSDPEHQLLTSEYTLENSMKEFWLKDQIENDFLAMMYACCDPLISQENQITFILKSLCGFSTKEIAKAFLTNEETISKRIHRTKDFFRKSKRHPVIPSNKELNNRTDAVLRTIYLMFNEGYNSTHSEELIREDIITQALFLCKTLLEIEQTQLPQVYALMALMCFHTSRTNSRLSAEGDLILLPEQDRNLWDSELIAHGNSYLKQSAFGEEISTFHLEAAIAYEHCIAASYETTNWKNILGYYDSLLSISNDPIISLNRCIVIMKLDGAEKAFNELKKLTNNILDRYYIYHALLGEIYNNLGQYNLAVKSLLTASELTQSRHEQKFLKQKLSSIPYIKN